MKFCPYCGATLVGSAVSFCAECGKPVNSPAKETLTPPKKSVQKPRPAKAKPTRRLHGLLAPRPKKKGSPVKKTLPPVRPNQSKHKNNAPVSVPKSMRIDENYDGYYNDVPTNDNGHTKEKLEPELIKRIVLIATGTLIIVILSVAAMYLL